MALSALTTRVRRIGCSTQDHVVSIDALKQIISFPGSSLRISNGEE
jgi:hypothetical protein